MIAHWDDVDWRRRAKGEMDAEWQLLGNAAGSVTVGLNRIRIAPGKLSTPPHSHGASEEIYFVLAGSGLAWQDEAVCEIRSGDCIVQRANEMEHTLRAGDDGLDILVYGTRHPTELGWLPRSNAIRLGWPWVEGRTDDPWDVEARSPPLEFAAPGERPPNVVNVGDVEDATDTVDRHGETWKELADVAGSVQSGLSWIRLDGVRGYVPPHCHSEEEELFVILDGEGTLELWPSPLLAERGIEREDHPVRAGHVIARPPATRIAHTLRAGDAGMTYLAYGTRRANDIVYFPRSKKIFWRGVGVIGRIEHLDFWDGETRP